MKVINRTASQKFDNTCELAPRRRFLSSATASCAQASCDGWGRVRYDTIRTKTSQDREAPLRVSKKVIRTRPQNDCEREAPCPLLPGHELLRNLTIQHPSCIPTQLSSSCPAQWILTMDTFGRRQTRLSYSRLVASVCYLEFNADYRRRKDNQ